MINIIILLLSTYIILSFGEWFLHKNVMHGDPEKLKSIYLIGGKLSKTAQDHLTHHKAISMKNKFVEAKYKKESKHKGLFFPWEVTILTFVFFYPIILLFNKFKHKKFLLFYSIIISILFSFIWNNLHPDIHEAKNKIMLRDGVPNHPKLLSHGRIYKWLWANHALHHLQKGEKGNFNIILPGADYILNTYQGKCYDNSEYCKKSKDKRICGKKKKKKMCF